MKRIAMGFVCAAGALLHVSAAGQDAVETFDRNMVIAEVVTNGLKWIDGRRLPLEGRAFDDMECYYDRLPANVRLLFVDCSKIALSPSVALSLKIWHNTATDKGGEDDWENQ